MMQTTDFGKQIKHKLVDLGKSQNWLIKKVADETGLYFDRSYLSKIMNGKISSQKMEDAIREILDLPEN